LSEATEQVTSGPEDGFAVTLYEIVVEPFCAAVCGNHRTTCVEVAKDSLVSPSSTGACGAELNVRLATDDGLPIFVEEPFLVIALTRKNVGAPALSPLETMALVEVDMVFATTDFQEVLFVLASIL
jgi:hypothetical protein